MKKQAIAFFTMFSLILMLSIYYITLPKETTKVSKNEASVISDLEDRSDNNKEDEKEINNEVISDPEADEESKNEAIIKNEKIKEDNTKQNEYSKAISDLGYENNVEIKDKTIYVSVKNSEQDDAIASLIMKTLYKLSSGFFVEVSFNSK